MSVQLCGNKASASSKLSLRVPVSYPTISMRRVRKCAAQLRNGIDKLRNIPQVIFGLCMHHLQHVSATA